MCKRNTVTFIVIGIYYLLSGVEYAVILPSLNLYLLSLGASQSFIGFVMASFSLTGLLSAPIYGRFTDKTKSTKAAVIFSNLFEIGGNMMYFAALNPYMILGSRLIAGIGSGSGSSIFGMISRNTSEEKRTAAFSQLMSLRQFGLLVGPACNLFLKNLDFYIGPLHVNALTSPGIFMALLWCLHTGLMFLCYHELESKDADSNGVVGKAETLAAVATEEDAQKWSVVFKDLVREEVIVCLSVTFIVMFVQTGMETLLTPMTLKLFNWGELPNSIFFLVAGVIIIASFLSLSQISKKVSDRLMLLIGMCVMTGLWLYFLVFIYFAVKAPIGAPWVLGVFCLHSTILVFDLPYVWVPQASLFSKVTSAQSQAFNQGMRLLVMGLGQILGPLWAASFLQNLTIMASVNLFVVALVTIMVIASYKRLQVFTLPTESDDTMPDERTPLLKSTDGAINI